MHKLLNAIGLAMKAGKCKSGDFVVEKLVRSDKAKLVILDSEASASTKERYTRLCQSRNIPILFAKSVGKAIGKPGRIILAVTDIGFTAMIERAAAEVAASSDAESSPIEAED